MCLVNSQQALRLMFMHRDEYISLESEKKNEKIFEPVRAWHFAVNAGNSLIEKWPLDNFKNNNYHLRLYGPNGFFREFIGNENDPEIHIDCEYETNQSQKNQLTGNIKLSIVNLSKSNTYNININDNAYKTTPVLKTINPSATEVIVLNLDKSFGWYDFSVVVQNNSSFIKRFAGRVETGKETFTDPFMGRSV